MLVITKIDVFPRGTKYWVHEENNENRREGFWTWNKWAAEEKVAKSARVRLSNSRWFFVPMTEAN